MPVWQSSRSDEQAGPGDRPGLVGGIRDTRNRWWAAVRSAGALRLTYEIGLAILLSGAATVASLSYDALPLAVNVVVAVAILVLVPLRLVYPVGAFLAAALLGVLTGGESAYVLLVLSASAGYRMKHVGRTVGAFAVALCCLAAAVWYWDEARDLSTMILVCLLFVMISVLPAVVAWAVARRRQQVSAMHWRNVQLHDQQAVVARQARSRERTRIARDLHDSLGHQLTLISLYAGTLGSASEEQRAETVRLLRTTSAAAMAELRQILGVLRQEETDESGVAQPLTSLEDLATAAGSAGAQVTLTRGGTPRPLPPLIEHAAYRVIQEGVTNALRHARGAPVDVILRYEPDALIAEVVNGAGMPHDGPTSGQGLIGLGERIRLAGGVLYHGTIPGNGFRLAAMLPYQAALPDGDGSLDLTPVTPTYPAGRPDGDGGAGPALATPMAPEPTGPAAARGAGDFAVLMSRSATRSRWGIAAVAVGIVAVLALCCTALVLTPMISVRPETYHAIQVGQSESEVREMLPDPEAAVTGAVGGDPRPPGATCIDYQASLLVQMEQDTEQDLLYRFCFNGGVLVAKATFHNKATG
jgi:signal transduction histidine kinase